VRLQEWPAKTAIFVMRVTNPENPDNGWHSRVDLQNADGNRRYCEWVT
jgi:hypothetical protein